jgi:diguanylate cyclase (GGDEF)-like protein/PAS domain S-box-containing protein
MRARRREGEALSAHLQIGLEDATLVREFIDRVDEGIYVTDAEGNFLDGNPALLRILGFQSLDELRQYSVEELVDPDQRREQKRILETEGELRDYELYFRRPDGNVRVVLDTGYARRDTGSGRIVYCGILHDITDRKVLEAQLLEQSTRDPLTGCFNRRYLQEFEQHLPKTWGCIAFDLDHFKQLNDEQGHQAGDEVLVRFGRFLMRSVRAEEAVVRMGGDEFLIVLPEADAPRTSATAERIQQTGGGAPVSFSMGFAARGEDEPLERTINRADQKLYAIRAERRGLERRSR